MRRIVAYAFVAAVAAAPAAVAGKKPVMPDFVPELTPFVGTWKNRVQTRKKKVNLWLVIREKDGKLQLRFQNPIREKKYTSGWDGQIELTMQVNIKQKRETRYRVATEPVRIEVSDLWRYTGSWKNRKTRVEAVYELTDDGKLSYTCKSLVDVTEDEEKPLPCFSPFVYERISDKTKWPD